MGFEPVASLGSDEPELWPENAASYGVFTDMQSSWVRGMDGSRTGLRFETMPFWLDVNDVPRADWRDCTLGVRVLEMEFMRCERERG